METDGGKLYLAHYPPYKAWDDVDAKLSLYKLNTDSENQEFSLEFIFDRDREASSKFGNNKDTPVMVNKRVVDIDRDPDYPAVGTLFLIDLVDTGREVRTNLVSEPDRLLASDYCFSSPHLAVLYFEWVETAHILKIWNVESSPLLPLYSIDID